MQAINVLNGQLATYRPGSYVTWSAEDIETATVLTGDRTIALIGEAEGGVPLGAYVLTSPTRARAVLRGGELLEAVLLAFNAAGAGGSLTVVAVNILGGTQATLAIPGSASGTFGTLTSAAYRERANQIKAQIFGTVSAGFSATVEDADSGFYLSGNRIGLALSLVYRGSGSAATAEVKTVNGQLSLVTTVTGAPQHNLTLPIGSSTTVNALVRSITLSGPYTAAASRDGRLDASKLDVTAAPVDIKTGAGVLTAIKADFALFFQTAAGGEISFTPGAAALPGASFTGNFTGGTTVDATSDAWSKAMLQLATVPLALIVPLTNSQVVLAGLRAELSVRNSAAQSKFSMMLAGFDSDLLPADNEPGNVETYANAVAAELSTINDYQFQLVTTTGTATLPVSGARGLLPLHLVAALIAGEIAGQGIDKSLTYSFVGLSNPFPTFDDRQTQALVRAGGLVIELPTAGGSARVVRDRTTYSGSDNAVYESGLSVRIMNSAARGMKALQDRYIPGAASAIRLADFQSAATDYFDDLVERGYLTADGVDRNGQAEAPYSFAVDRTKAGGRHVISRSRVVPKSEFVVGEHSMVARSVEFQVSSN